MVSIKHAYAYCMKTSCIVSFYYKCYIININYCFLRNNIEEFQVKYSLQMSVFVEIFV